MHIAVSHGSVNCIKIYLKHFADLMMENGNYYKPLELIYDRNTRDFFHAYFKKLQKKSNLPKTNKKSSGKNSSVNPVDDAEVNDLLSGRKKGVIDSEKVPPHYLCTNWFIQNKVFGHTTKRLSCCKRRGYLTVKSDYMERLKPSLKVFHSLVSSNQPTFKNIHFGFKI